jgi:hypothetical protein
MMALGVGLSWVNLLYLLEFSPRMRLMTRTFENSMPDLMMFFLEVGPIFLAFTFFATTLFNNQVRYSNLYETLISMLCIMAGDEIQPSLFIFADAAGTFGTVFGMIYTVIFFVIVQNMMV